MSKAEFDVIKNVSFSERYFAKLNKFDELFLFIRTVKNWPQYLILKFIFRNRTGLKIKEIKSVQSTKHYMLFKWFNKVINFYVPNRDVKFEVVWSINENFIKEQYKWLDVRDKDVVDVGANVGDTAIYFALKGAKRVYAFEPYPYSYNIAMKNIELNHLEDKITLLNEGCGRSGFVTIKEDYKNTGSTDLKNFKEGKKIRIESLDEIVKRFNLKHAALKVDCEGCEYDLILNASDEALHAFDQIIIEYHYGYRNLVKRLRQAGFKVKYSLPKYSQDTEALDSNRYLGLIYAKIGRMVKNNHIFRS